MSNYIYRNFVHTILPDDRQSELKAITVCYWCDKAINGGTQVWYGCIPDR